MAIDLDAFQSLRNRAREAHGAAQRAAGAFENDLKKLHDDFGVSTIEAAMELLATRERELAELDAKCEVALKEFSALWEDKKRKAAELGK